LASDHVRGNEANEQPGIDMEVACIEQLRDPWPRQEKTASDNRKGYKLEIELRLEKSPTLCRTRSGYEIAGVSIGNARRQQRKELSDGNIDKNIGSVHSRTSRSDHDRQDDQSLKVIDEPRHKGQEERAVHTSAQNIPRAIKLAKIPAEFDVGAVMKAEADGAGAAEVLRVLESESNTGILKAKIRRQRASGRQSIP